MAKFAELFVKQEVVGGRLIIVMNGFDGLSTHEVSFLNLLEAHTEMCDLFAFADDPRDESQPRRFFQANTEQVCQIIRGDINLIDGQEDVDELESGSGSGIRTLELFQGLRKITKNRNVNPKTRNLGKYPCNGKCGEKDCKQKFATNYEPSYHLHRAKKDNLECRLGCGQKFTKPYSRDRHEKDTCKKRPGFEEKKQKRARKRPAEAPLPRTSDGGRLDYSGAISNPALAQNMPIIITDEAVLTANGLPTDAAYRGDVIYRGERVCRWPDCEKRRKVYSGFSQLRPGISMNSQSILWGRLINMSKSSLRMVSSIFRSRHRASLMWGIRGPKAVDAAFFSFFQDGDATESDQGKSGLGNSRV
ncbi:hypothetical protein N7481_011883 [Penicillium waksmanii]|uniref:uncharacterized protein n=1 Tax=Penicillium waksmanii TaxID=69791 RepID=UPI002547A166|nr:uncharacterized protein N7481_011883 [Penicillium waksmanii]KAJ5974673.1 hypothetical protein N7481_011883 [Penicillium waksmanii]